MPSTLLRLPRVAVSACTLSWAGSERELLLMVGSLMRTVTDNWICSAFVVLVACNGRRIEKLLNSFDLPYLHPNVLLMYVIAYYFLGIYDHRSEDIHMHS